MTYGECQEIIDTLQRLAKNTQQMKAIRGEPYGEAYTWLTGCTSAMSQALNNQELRNDIEPDSPSLKF